MVNASPTSAPGTDAEAEIVRLQALRELRLIDAAPQERLERITRMASTVFGMPMAAVSLVGADRQFAVSQRGPADLNVTREESFCAHTMQQEDAMVIEDALADTRFEHNSLVTGDPHLRFYAGYPLTVGTGQRVGALCVLDTTPRTFSPQQAALLQEMAHWVERELAAVEDHDLATATQRAAGPAEAPWLPGYDNGVLSVPSVGLRGDFVHWRSLPGTLEITLGDLMATGSAAGLNAAMIGATVAALSLRGELADLVGDTTVLVEDQLERTGSYATVFHGRIHRDGQISFVDAGLGTALIVRAAGGHEHLGTPDLPLGVLPGSTARIRTAHLDPGDTLLVFTDGVLQLWDGSMGHLAELADLFRGSDTIAGALAEVELMGRDRAPGKALTVLATRRLPAA
ncbi:SpoIIE family protein phosphatase [Nakamurella flavida]|uniref:SpoIIE family protein phosphatase n=1 Tax=Nakamurella flavida TaxID=363630 RepID=A0A939C434_9ACTN|nr:SpoIIE family protein phosphatase [Nakamurella flavida]MBM9477676.1 SpoIIE family protein phosphatase [Nakamurella flavida]MDP9779228.1 hypothetical protein [Nakamurella flavida]